MALLLQPFHVTRIFLLSAVLFLAVGHPAAVWAQSALTFDGDTAIMTVEIKADRTADFEQLMTRLRDALRKSENPDHVKQANGWRLLKLPKPLPDGNAAYIHLIQPVVAGVDYTILQILYDAYPEEKQALYDQYRAAFDKNLGLFTGSVVVDLK